MQWILQKHTVITNRCHINTPEIVTKNSSNVWQITTTVFIRNFGKSNLWHYSLLEMVGNLGVIKSFLSFYNNHNTVWDDKDYSLVATMCFSIISGSAPLLNVYDDRVILNIYDVG